MGWCEVSDSMNGKMSPEWVTKWSGPGCWFRASFPPDNYQVLFFVRARPWPDLSPHHCTLEAGLVSGSGVLLTAVSGPLSEAGHWGCPAGLWCWAKRLDGGMLIKRIKHKFKLKLSVLISTEPSCKFLEWVVHPHSPKKFDQPGNKEIRLPEPFTCTSAEVL